MLSMAIADSYPPSLLLFDYLLASSWTWLAIILATVATTLRALEVRLPRRRFVNLETSQPPSAIAVSSSSSSSFFSSSSSSSVKGESLFCRFRTEQPSFSPISLQRGFRQRSRSKSTSALEKLHRNGEGFLRSSMEILSSVLDADFSPSLKKIASASKLFNGQSKTHQRMGLHAFATQATSDNRKAELCSSANFGFDSDEVLGLGFDNGTLVQKGETPCHSSVKEELIHQDEDAASSQHWLPPWAYSLCDPLQNTFSHGGDNSFAELSPFQVSPCFEKQLGWDKMLESKLGSSWNFPFAGVSGCPQSVCTMESPNIVRMWTGKKKKLLKALHVDESSTLALDVRALSGLACTGNIAGGISLWELGRKTCAKASASFSKPVLALSMNSEQGATIVGSDDGLGLWDQRSSICKPLRFANSTSHQKAHVSALKSRENGVCIADNNCSLSMYDLRKLYGEPLHSGPAPKRLQVSSEDEAEFDLWEKLTCDFEEDFCEEGSVSPRGSVVEWQKGSSFLSQLASFMRVFSTSVS